jgi:hypothetical protein
VTSEPTNPYAAPSHEATNDVVADLAPSLEGSRLRFGRAVELPRVCVGCGTRTRVKYKTEDFECISPVVWLAFPFIGVLAAFLRPASRRARVRIPRCRSCEGREARIKVLRGPAGLGLVVVLLIAATLAGNGLPVSGGIVAGLAVPLFVIGFRRWLSGGIRASYIDEGTVTLRGIHPATLSAMTTPPTASEGADNS